MVVNGYDAIFGFALEIDLRKVLFPAFGNPTSPKSAIIFRSKTMFRIFPLFPMKLFPEQPPPPVD